MDHHSAHPSLQNASQRLVAYLRPSACKTKCHMLQEEIKTAPAMLWLEGQERKLL